MGMDKPNVTDVVAVAADALWGDESFVKEASTATDAYLGRSKQSEDDPEWERAYSYVSHTVCLELASRCFPQRQAASSLIQFRQTRRTLEANDPSQW